MLGEACRMRVLVRSSVRTYRTVDYRDNPVIQEAHASGKPKFSSIKKRFKQLRKRRNRPPVKIPPRI